MLLLFSKSPGHRIKGPDAYAEVFKMGLDARKPDFGACEQQGAGLCSCARSLISAFIVRFLESVIS